jgi:hypothetical protein
MVSAGRRNSLSRPAQNKLMLLNQLLMEISNDAFSAPNAEPAARHGVRLGSQSEPRDDGLLAIGLPPDYMR